MDAESAARMESIGKATQETAAKNRETALELKKTADALRQAAEALREKVILSKNAVLVMEGGDKGEEKVIGTSPAVVPAPEARSSWALSPKGEAAPTTLLVSEIDFKQEVGERRGVVNGQAVREGMVVEGARVDRIFKDRIRFVVNGRYQEVRLEGNRTN
jgi:hypothetical protein